MKLTDPITSILTTAMIVAVYTTVESALRWVRQREALTIMARVMYCIERRRFESDRSLRARCAEVMRMVGRGPPAGMPKEKDHG